MRPDWRARIFLGLCAVVTFLWTLVLTLGVYLLVHALLRHPLQGVMQ